MHYTNLNTIKEVFQKYEPKLFMDIKYKPF